MGTTPTDIITYIGVPLAVIGVSPILWLATRALWKKVKIKAELNRYNTPTLSTRAELQSGIVEVTLEKYHLEVLPRDAGDEYWEWNPNFSPLRGGSWTCFNWKEPYVRIGTKTYRLQYSDPVRQLQARINFGALLMFMLDRGATMDGGGFRVLREAGLRAPVGTTLLKGLDGKSALMVTSGDDDDADRALSLLLRWNKTWRGRDLSRLPPNWVRFKPPKPVDDRPPTQPADEKASKSERRVDSEPTIMELSTGDESKEADRNPSVVADLEQSSLRVTLNNSGLEDGLAEDNKGLPSPVKLSVDHLRPTRRDSARATKWFASIVKVTAARQGSFCQFPIPEDIIRFISRAYDRDECIPCGVLVELKMLSVSGDVWAPRDAHAEWWEEEQAHMRRPFNKSRSSDDFLQRMDHKFELEQECYRLRIPHALKSPGLHLEAVVKAVLAWLKEHKTVHHDVGVEDVVGEALHGMLIDAVKSANLTQMLETWRVWNERGMMEAKDFKYVEENKICFAQVACILHTMGVFVNSVKDQVVEDVGHCMRVYQDVLLG